MEFVILGNSLKATAIDPESGLEATVIGPANAPQSTMAQAARRKLVPQPAPEGAHREHDAGRQRRDHQPEQADEGPPVGLLLIVPDDVGRDEGRDGQGRVLDREVPVGNLSDGDPVGVGAIGRRVAVVQPALLDVRALGDRRAKPEDQRDEGGREREDGRPREPANELRARGRPHGPRA